MDIKGTGVALVTPFKEDYSVDYEALARLVDYQIDGGVEYIVVLGTTGEAVTLSEADRAEVIR
ncbi:MAG: dihydrodipicolinate synthase family protein, partial [[Clostridium] fimetarium]|nr:dihydrodipicolinate synthase family protein [[Clostridium] fimetarium]